MSKVSFELVAEFSTILPDEIEQPTISYVQGIDREFIIRIGLYFLGINTNDNKWENWKEFLQGWFNSENAAFAQKIAKNCARQEREKGQKIQLFYQIAFLRLLEFALSLPPSTVTQSPNESEVNLFRAYLGFAGRLVHLHPNSEKYLKAQTDHEQLILQIVNMMFPTSDLDNYVLEDIVICQLVKGTLLFEFLELNSSYHPMLNGFYNRYGITHWEQYFEAILPLAQTITKRSKEGWLELIIEKNEHYEKNKNFLSGLSIDKIDGTELPDFASLRSNPIFISNGRLFIIYYLFVVENIFKSLYFNLKFINDTLSQDLKIKGWRSKYGEQFSEAHLLYEVLGYSYKQQNCLALTGNEIKKDIDGGPDYYVREVNNVYIFESKDTFVPGDIKQSGDLEAIIADIKKKLYYTEINDQISPKAVKQLVENVRRALLKENTFDRAYSENEIFIYPVLVLHDTSFDTPGINRIVNDWFRVEINELRSKGYDVSKVFNITIINIDVLIKYSSCLRNKRYSLDSLIRNYYLEMEIPANVTVPSISEAVNYIASKSLSFSHFIDGFTSRGFQNCGDTGIVASALKKLRK